MPLSPVIIDGSLLPRSQGLGQRVGTAVGGKIFRYGGAFYAAGYLTQDQKVRMYKSADLSSWSVVDSAGSPTGHNGATGFFTNGANINVTAGKIVVAGTQGVFTTVLRYHGAFLVFDLATDTWEAGAPQTVNSAANVGTNGWADAIYRNDGSVVVVHQGDEGANGYGSVRLSVYSGGSWAVDSQLIVDPASPAGSRSFFASRNLIYDGSYVHLFYDRGDRFSGAWSLRHRSISGGNSVSSESTIWTQPTSYPDPDPFNGVATRSHHNAGYYQASTNLIFIPIAHYIGNYDVTGISEWNPIVLVGSGGTAGPTFSSESVSGEDATEIHVAEDLDGNIICGWRAHDSLAPVPYALRYSQRSGGGTWSAATTFYDLGADSSLYSGQWQESSGAPLAPYNWTLRVFPGAVDTFRFCMMAECNIPVLRAIWTPYVFYAPAPPDHECCCIDYAFMP